MFEKDAEERTEEKYTCNEKPIIPLEAIGYKKGWQDGAEFGYNKANEWQFVKDGLPPVKKEYCGRSEPVLVISKNKQVEYAQYIEKARTWARGICEIGFEPYAWKEIVLPKEIE